MDNLLLEALAYDEAQRLIEKCFSFNNPYSCEIDAEAIPFCDREKFYAMVEEELSRRGERISRRAQFFKIERYQNRSPNGRNRAAK